MDKPKNKKLIKTIRMDTRRIGKTIRNVPNKSFVKEELPRLEAIRDMIVDLIEQFEKDKR